jgi:hypothetical protein
MRIMKFMSVHRYVGEPSMASQIGFSHLMLSPFCRAKKRAQPFKKSWTSSSVLSRIFLSKKTPAWFTYELAEDWMQKVPTYVGGHLSILLHVEGCTLGCHTPSIPL